MKRIIMILSYLTCILSSSAQEASTHIVQRGETLESIAQNCGITIEDLKAANPNMGEYFYVGLKLNIPPVEQAKVDYDLIPSFMDGLLAKAADFESQEKLGKAQDIYKNILKTDDNTYVHFLNGRCYYKKEKWKDAIEELETVVERTDCTENTRLSARTLLSSAKEKREQQLENRRQVWGEIGNFLAVTAISATSMVLAQKYSNSAHSTPYSTSHQSQAGNLDYLLDPNYALIQTKIHFAQIEAEKEKAMRVGYEQAKMYRPNLTWEEYKWEVKMAEAEAYRASMSGTGSIGNNDATNTKSSFNSSGVSSHECAYCRGTGKRVEESNIATFGVHNNVMKHCSECGRDYHPSTSHRHVQCRYCGGTGKMR